MKNKVVACIVARTVSTRLPLKVLRDLLPGVTMLDYLIQRLKRIDRIDEIYICTSHNKVDDILEDVSNRNNVKIYRGSEDQVIERLLGVGKIEKPKYLVRITGDNPLTTVEYLESQVDVMEAHNLDYTRLSGVPIGATAEVIEYEALKKCNSIMDPDISEYMMLYLFEPDNFKCGIITPFMEDYSKYSITVDTHEDFHSVKNLINSIGKENELLKLEKIVDFFTTQRNNDLKSIDYDSIIKLPYDKSMTYREFLVDMERRKNGAIQIKMYD
jgi:spore coat polysaccharide biosynthesis protein SpsF